MFAKKIVSLFVAVAATAFLFACEEPVNEFTVLSAAGDTYFTAYTTPDTSASPNITIADLLVLINSDDPPYIIDFRSAEDYAAAHIKGAINMALTDLDDNIDTLPTDQLIVNVCYTGQNASFATAVMNLVGQDPAYEGLEARNLKFGMCSITTDTNIVPKSNKWASAIEEDEFTLDTTPASTDTENEFPDPATGETTIAGIVKANLDEAANGWSIDAASVYSSTGDYFIVNYWPAEEYADPGHIPGAYQFTPKSSLKSDESLNLLPTDETVVIYCYTGQTSAQVVAYLRLLGYDAKSLLFGVNGFAYNSMTKSKYSAPVDDYTSILE